VLALYDRVLAKAQTNSSLPFLHYYHLAAYGMDSVQGTRVWLLNGEKHDQDKALLKVRP